MIVLYPHTRHHPESLAAVRAQAGLRVLGWWVAPDDEAYWRALRTCWTDAGAVGGSLTIVEQDVVIPPGCIAGFDACGEPICLHPQPRHTPPHIPLERHLGCVRFSAAYIAAHADLIEVAGTFSQGRPARHWEHLDTAVWWAIGDHLPHTHTPPVVHLPRSIEP